MRIAITGGDGFVGGHVARMLESAGHDVVVISRRTGLDLAAPDLVELRRRLASCDAVVICAGVNRESGLQTYARVHVSATRFIVEAAREGGVQRVILLSYLRARPDGPTAYHRSKWVAEQIVRDSGLAYTIVKPGVIFGRGDHLIHHLSRALRTFPVFGLLAGRPRLVAPVAVQDVARVLAAAAVGDPRLRQRTFGLIGPEVMKLDDAVRRVGRFTGRHPVYISLPITAHLVIAWLGERLMRIPLISLAQVRILQEGATTVLPFGDTPPADLIPTSQFDRAAILAGLPPDGSGFGVRDLRWCRR